MQLRSARKIRPVTTMSAYSILRITRFTQYLFAVGHTSLSKLFKRSKMNSKQLAGAKENLKIMKQLKR